MICRHKSGDPACGATSGGWRSQENERYNMESKDLEIKKLKEQIASFTPDNTKFEIEDIQEVGKHLVMKVSYPNCKTCSYEGNKVLVYLNTSITSVLKWRIIDPHFSGKVPSSVKEAPSPNARFPASNDGWKDAISFASMKNKLLSTTRE